MSIIVQKYGGSSVENKEKLNLICNKIIKEKNRNNKVTIVVSAQGKTTNMLIEKANEYIDFSDEISKRELDFLLATGEMQTASLLSLMLNSKGIKTVCMTGYQAGIITNSEYGNAKILDVVPAHLFRYLDEDYVVIVTGFQGTDKFGNITTLGRGGSDLTAVAIAAALKAKKCEIYSDIDGIYSADPKIIENAKLLKEITYDEMLEAASAGAKVLHNRSVNLAKECNVKINTRSTFTKSKGSLVQKGTTENFDIHFITKKDDISKICIVGPMMLSNKDSISKIFQLASQENIEIYMISFSELAINIIVDTRYAHSFMGKLHKILIEEKTQEY